jgi:hypothetical protein
MFEGVMRRWCGASVVRMRRHSEGGASVCPANNSACVRAQPQTCDIRKLHHILRDVTCLVTSFGCPVVTIVTGFPTKTPGTPELLIYL